MAINIPELSHEYHNRYQVELHDYWRVIIHIVYITIALKLSVYSLAKSCPLFVDEN